MTRISLTVTTGTVPFSHPSLTKPFETWYRIVGKLPSTPDCASVLPPLIVLHGGPGATHAYLRPTFDLLAARTGRCVIYYDQIGTGLSTHARERRLDESFWTPDLFAAELDNLVRALLPPVAPFHLYGQGWGAMLAAWYSGKGRALGLAGVADGRLRTLVLGSGTASMRELKKANRALLARLDDETQLAILRGDETGDHESEGYKKAARDYYDNYMYTAGEWPSALRESYEWMETDDTTYVTMTGPSEVSLTGSLRDFDVTEDCRNITQPTLVMNGEHDACQDNCIAPLFWNIPKAKWITLQGLAHLFQLEHPDRAVGPMAEFLKGADESRIA